MNSGIKDLVTFREGVDTDLGLIYSTWLNGLYYGNDWFREIDQETFFDKYRKAIEAILFRPGITIKVACLKEDTDVILAYAIFSQQEPGSILHWAFTKPVWRKLGLAKELIPIDIISVTHLTKVGRAIKPKKWKFNPFI